MRSSDEPAQGGRTLETKVRLPTFASISDDANACDRSMLGTNMHTSRPCAGRGGGAREHNHSPTRRKRSIYRFVPPGERTTRILYGLTATATTGIRPRSDPVTAEARTRDTAYETNDNYEHAPRHGVTTGNHSVTACRVPYPPVLYDGIYRIANCSRLGRV